MRQLKIPAIAYVKRPLATLDLHKTFERRVVSFQAEWRGAYELGLVMPSRVPNPLPDDWQASNAHVAFSWSDGSGELRVKDAFRSPWWAETNSGFSLAVFRVPDDVPLNKEVTVELTLEHVCGHVARHFQTADVFLCKISDK